MLFTVQILKAHWGNMIVILGDINKTADLKTWVSIKGTVVTFNFTLKKKTKNNYR